MLEINITIGADKEGNFTPQEQRVLDALTGADKQPGPSGGAVIGVATVQVKADLEDTVTDSAQKVAEAQEKVAEAEKPKRTRRTKEQIAADKAAEEDTGPAVLAEDPPAEVLEGTLVDDDDPAEQQLKAMEDPTLDRALEHAQKVLGQKGGQKIVKDALEKLGVERVGHLEGDNIGQFLSMTGA